MPSRPANGLLLTEKVISTVGSEILTNGMASGAAGAQMVSADGRRRPMPEKHTMSPARRAVALARASGPSNRDRSMTILARSSGARRGDGRPQPCPDLDAAPRSMRPMADAARHSRCSRWRRPASARAPSGIHSRAGRCVDESCQTAGFRSFPCFVRVEASPCPARPEQIDDRAVAAARPSR